ncbi:hypothetical protein T02_6385 [Trichinella nativa]|uniref:Uncharacterized protein n=1 Tax=Trichinella nativa TaxID=6335 RepID=A0A0V1KPW8_9BILA|nr:hypothetical protein T02_6385 [Trichinella nativa]
MRSSSLGHFSSQPDRTNCFTCLSTLSFSVASAITLAVTGNSACNSTINFFTPLDGQNLHQITRHLTREVWTNSQLDKSFSCGDIQYQTSNSLAQLPTLPNGMQPFALRLSLNRIL